MSGLEILKTKKIVFFLVKLSYSLKGFNYLQVFLDFSKQREFEDTVQVFPEAFVLEKKC